MNPAVLVSFVIPVFSSRKVAIGINLDDSLSKYFDDSSSFWLRSTVAWSGSQAALTLRWCGQSRVYRSELSLSAAAQLHGSAARPRDPTRLHTMTNQPDAWPQELLRKADWRFWKEQTYDNRSDFNEAVRRWHARLKEDQRFGWHPDEVALSAPRVRVEYFGVIPELEESDDFDGYEDGEDYAALVADLVSDNGRDFTAGELLYKLHNAAVRHLDSVDHCYMEGLRLKGEDPSSDVPVYQMIQGS